MIVHLLCVCVSARSNATSLHTFNARMFEGNNRRGSEQRGGGNAKDKKGGRSRRKRRRRGGIKMRGGEWRRRRRRGDEGARTQGIQGENDEESEGLAQRL